MDKILTLGDVAERFGVQAWRVARLYERKLLPEPPRFGRSRIVKESELPTIEDALRKAGYLK